MDFTTLIFGSYIVGMLTTFSWGFVQFHRNDDRWYHIGDTAWYAQRDGARRMLLAPLSPLLVIRFMLAITACALAITGSFLVRVIRVARLKA